LEAFLGWLADKLGSTFLEKALDRKGYRVERRTLVRALDELHAKHDEMQAVQTVLGRIIAQRDAYGEKVIALSAALAERDREIGELKVEIARLGRNL
jgi:hypothetical protein